MASRTGISAGHLHKMLTGSGRSRFDPMGLALVGFLGGDPARWAERWSDAEQRQQERERTGGFPPLPWLDEPDPDQPPATRAVGDWDGWSPLGRAWARFARLRFLPAVLWGALTAWLSRLRRGPARRRREVMLRKVRRHARDHIDETITGPYLTPAFVRLSKAPTPGRRRVRKPRLITRPFTGGGIRALFEEAAHELVLVGDAGIGKSVQMAVLADALAEEALCSGGLAEPPLPVLLSLSPYAGQPLEEWIVQQVGQVYDVAPQLTRQWLGTGMLLPLLDGLDQVPARHRRECATQLRRYRRACAGVVIACRDRDLVLSLEIGGELAALCAPTRRQVQEYLVGPPEKGDAYRDVRDALDADPELWTLLRSPLMLNVIRTTYEDRAAAELRVPGLTVEQRRDRVFDAYVLHLLRRPGAYDGPVTLHWLSALAERLHQRGEEVLHLDRIDGSWVPAWLRPHLNTVPRRAFQYAVLLLIMLPWCWMFTALDLIRPDGSTALFTSTFLTFLLVLYVSDRTNLRGAARRATPAVPLALPLSAGDFTPDGTTLPGLLMLAWFWTDIDVRKGCNAGSYRPSEQLRWSWVPTWLGTLAAPRLHPVQMGISYLAIVLLSVLLTTGADVFLAGTTRTSGLAAAAFVVLFLYLFVGDGLRADLKDTRRRPNEGIRRSARYALLFGGVTLLLTVGVGFAAVRATTDAGVRTALLTTLFAGTLLSASNAYRVGGAACVYYWTVRIVLARERAAPYRYGHFLGDAERRILLRRSGSGFRFPHRLIQEHIRAHAPALRERLKSD
ncbi:NACHT domain-containing protein [Streptomyces sp. NPDC058867]|uniref:NACHT domain-containing protein n=1 Tax=unclassified Streptomyces TaxID=2593676 RepID=UPI003686A64F